MNEWWDEYCKMIGQVEPNPSDVNPEPQDPEDPGEPEKEKVQKPRVDQTVGSR
jgi:hypothetical protein